jgi:transcriptional regulator with XRE-family HTH domain
MQEAASRYTPELRIRLKAWLRDVMKQRDWTAERWAREASIAPTTITRFLNTDDPARTPSVRTLEKLARAAGVPAMHEQSQVLIAIVHRKTLLQHALNVSPQCVDLFQMPPEDYLPALPRYVDCRVVEIDNGRMAIARPCPAEGIPIRARVLVEWDCTSVRAYWYLPPYVVSVETGTQPPHILNLNDPETHILGIMVGEFVPYGEDT